MGRFGAIVAGLLAQAMAHGARPAVEDVIAAVQDAEAVFSLAPGEQKNICIAKGIEERGATFQLWAVVKRE